MKITDLVPYAWYDLIARIVPGSVGIFLFYRIRFQSAGPIQFLLVAILSYLVGLSLEKISALIHMIPRIKKFFPPYIKKFFPPYIKKFFSFDKDSGLSLWDAAHKVPQAGSMRVRKMLAELQLFRSLSACFLIYGLSLIPQLELILFQWLCVFPHQCGDLRRFHPSWAWALIFVLIALMMELFAWHHKRESWKTVIRYLNHQQG